MDSDRILPRLLVGSCPENAEDIDRLRRDLGVTAILSLQTDQDHADLEIDGEKLEVRYQDVGIALRRCPVRDFDAEDLCRSLPDCVKALHELLGEGHTVYVHCTAGVNRSPSVVIAYLHWVQGWPLDKAFAHVMSRRICDPNLAALQQASEELLRNGQPRGLPRSAAPLRSGPSPGG